MQWMREWCDGMECQMGQMKTSVAMVMVTITVLVQLGRDTMIV